MIHDAARAAARPFTPPGEDHVQTVDRLLLAAGSLTAGAALLHVAIIPGGPDWYRFFGAGEGMARMAARGFLYPTVLTACIAAVLGLWALYAFSGAGVIRRLPFLPLVLTLIAGAFLLRGILGVPVVLFVDHPYAHELAGRMTFMVVSSAVCIFLGVCYAAGAVRLRRRSAAPDRGVSEADASGRCECVARR